MASNAPENTFVNFIAIPSLKRVALVKISTALWTQTGLVRGSELDPNKVTLEQALRKVTKNVVAVLPCLPLPKQMVNELATVLHPIGLQALSFVTSEKRKRSYDFMRIVLSREERARCLTKLTWTMRGIIDEEQAFRVLLRAFRDKGSNQTGLGSVEDRGPFGDACEFCLEGVITELWEAMPNIGKESLRNAMQNSSDFLGYWTRLLYDNDVRFSAKVQHSSRSLNNSMLERLMQSAIEERKVTSVKYLWSVISEEQRQRNVGKWTESVFRFRSREDRSWFRLPRRIICQKTSRFTDILCFFLSKLDHKQQAEILENNPIIAMQAISLKWPYQEFIVPIFSRCGSYCRGDAYSFFLSDLASSLESPGAADTFREIWHGSPPELKNHFIDWLSRGNLGGLFGHAILSGDSSFVHLVLDYADLAEFRYIIFALAFSEKREFFLLIGRDQLHMVDELVDRYGLSEMEIDVLKRLVFDRFLEFFKSRHAETEVDDLWGAGLNLIRWRFGSEAEIEAFRKNLGFESEHFNAVVDCLIFKGDYSAMERFLRWCACPPDSTVADLKKRIPFTRDASVIRRFCFSHWNSLVGLVNWCYSSEEEIHEFKRYLAGIVFENEQSPTSFLFDVLTYEIAMSRSVDCIETMLGWIFGSAEKVLEVKQSLLMSEHCLSAIENWSRQHFHGNIRSITNDRIRLFVKFFLPLGPTAFTEFKQFVKQKVEEGKQQQWMSEYVEAILWKFAINVGHACLQMFD